MPGLAATATLPTGFAPLGTNASTQGVRISGLSNGDQSTMGPALTNALGVALYIATEHARRDFGFAAIPAPIFATLFDATNPDRYYHNQTGWSIIISSKKQLSGEAWRADPAYDLTLSEVRIPKSEPSGHPEQPDQNHTNINHKKMS